MTKDEALKLAMEALENAEYGDYDKKELNEAITAIKEALAQPEQEPFGYFRYDLRLDAWVQNRAGLTGTPFYTSPPQRKPLTLDELWRVFTRSGLSQFHQRDSVVEYKYQKCIEEFARAIEAAHGIKGEA